MGQGVGVITRMKKNYLLALCLLFSACSMVKENMPEAEKLPASSDANNLLLSYRLNKLNGLQWLNPASDVEFDKGVMRITSEQKTDFFINPETGEKSASAPVLFSEVKGDFVATALVRPDFTDKWNACSLMVFLDDKHWIKFAFENSDATGKSIVTVVTRAVSDDANGVPLTDYDQVWLKLIRKGDNYAMHWSVDGELYKMSRLSHMPEAETVRVGVEAQSPDGGPATHDILFFGIEQRTVADLRSGM
jgi:regulation of enolase protein 1 (concanavalin A-like superfamily)